MPSFQPRARRTIQFRGLVRMAEAARQVWKEPARRSALVAELQARVADIDAQLRNARCTASSLSGPSRRALEFLRALINQPVNQPMETDLPELPAGGSARARLATKLVPGGRTVLPSSTRLAGLRTGLIAVVDDLAQALLDSDGSIADDASGPDSAARLRLLELAAAVESELASVDPATLTEASRRSLAYLRYLVVPRHWHRLMWTVELAQQVLTPHVLSLPRTRDPVLVRLLPCNLLYRWRVGVPKAGVHARRATRCTLLDLPPAMMCFSADDFALLARRICGDPTARSPLQARQQLQDYRRLIRTIDSYAQDPRSDSSAPTAGAFHDLAASFERVRATYFAAEFPAPQLAWSRSLSGRKFGQYDPITDTVHVASTLDSPTVPAFVVDYVMYHELLHKHVGSTPTRLTTRFHTATFRELEQRFERYEAAEAFLQQLAARG